MTEITDIYGSFSWLFHYMTLSSLWMDPIRQIGWWILLGMGALVDVAYETYIKLIKYNLYDLVSARLAKASGAIEMDIAPIVMTITLIVLGVTIMVSAKKRKELGNGIAVAVLLLFSGPILFSTCADFLSNTVPWIEDALEINAVDTVFDYGGAGDGSIDVPRYDPKVSTKIIRASSVDILMSAKTGAIASVSTDPSLINVNERVGGYFGNDDIFPYVITRVDSSGVAYGRKLTADSPFMKEISNEGLYRYSFNFFVPFVTLLVLFIAIILGAFKTSKLMFELVFIQVLSPIIFASDLTNAGRSKETVKKIINTYILIAIIFFIVVLFMTVSLATLEIENNFLKIIILAGAAWGVIDGPEHVVKLLGMDAGVRSGWGAVAGGAVLAGAASRLIGGGAKSAVNKVGAAGQAGSRTIDRLRTKKSAPGHVTEALKGATRQSKRAFHDKNSPTYHNVDALDNKKKFKEYGYFSASSNASEARDSTASGHGAGPSQGATPPSAEAASSNASEARDYTASGHGAGPSQGATPPSAEAASSNTSEARDYTASGHGAGPSQGVTPPSAEAASSNTSEARDYTAPGRTNGTRQGTPPGASGAKPNYNRSRQASNKPRPPETRKKATENPSNQTFDLPTYPGTNIPIPPRFDD